MRFEAIKNSIALSVVSAMAFVGAETFNALKVPSELPEGEAYDVVVVGGTSAGVSAAVGAHSHGAKVIVISPRPALNDDLAGKLLLDFDVKVEKGHRSNLFDYFRSWRDAPFSSYGHYTPLQIKRMGDEILMRNAIPFRMYTAVTEILRDDAGRVAGVRTQTRNGGKIIRAKTVVDATERASLARAAGAEALPFSGGEIEFERRIIAGDAPVAQGLVVRELPSRNTVTKVDGVQQEPFSGTVTGRYFSCSMKIALGDLTVRTLQEVEQKMRDATWVKSTLDAADTVRFFPPDRIVKSVPGVYVASLVGEADEATARLRFSNVAEDAFAAEAVGKAAAAAARLAVLPGKPVCAAGDVAVIAECDVFVAGLGTGGAPAAVTASREGAKVIGCDYLFKTGGLMTEGLIGNYCFGYRGGFTKEIDESLHGFGKVYSVSKAEWFRSEARKAGGEIWFGTWVTGVRTEGEGDARRIVAVEVAMPDGTRGLVKAKVFIDATGNADLAADAGEETEFIREDELSLQGAGSTPKVLGASYRNTDYAFVDDTDAADLAFFTLRARNAMSFWAWDQAQMVNSRERRRLKGAFELSVQDAFLNRTYPDIIAITRSNFDTHGQTFDNQFLVEDPGHIGRTVYLPYRCFLPKRLNGLLVIGLGMSAHRDAMPILRMQPDVQNQGYVAGIAAVQSIREGVVARDVDMKKLQKRLVEKGVIPAELAGLKDNFPLSDKVLEKAIETLPDGYKGLPELLTSPERAIPLLKAAYLADVSKGLPYAHVLGILGDDTGAEALVKAVDGFATWDKGWNYKGMDQFGRSVSWLDTYLIALGRTRSPLAFGAISAKAAKLVESDAYSHFRSIALSFEALGDKRAIPELARILEIDGVGGNALKRGDVIEDVPGYGRFTRSNVGIGDIERSKCLRELCVARALYRLGDTADKLGERSLRAFAEDPRGAYANHAKLVLSE